MLFNPPNLISIVISNSLINKLTSAGRGEGLLESRGRPFGERLRFGDALGLAGLSALVGVVRGDKLLRGPGLHQQRQSQNKYPLGSRKYKQEIK